MGKFIVLCGRIFIFRSERCSLQPAFPALSSPSDEDDGHALGLEMMHLSAWLGILINTVYEEALEA